MPLPRWTRLCGPGPARPVSGGAELPEEDGPGPGGVWTAVGVQRLLHLHRVRQAEGNDARRAIAGSHGAVQSLHQAGQLPRYLRATADRGQVILSVQQQLRPVAGRALQSVNGRASLGRGRGRLQPIPQDLAQARSRPAGPACARVAPQFLPLNPGDSAPAPPAKRPRRRTAIRPPAPSKPGSPGRRQRGVGRSPAPTRSTVRWSAPRPFARSARRETRIATEARPRAGPGRDKRAGS